MSAEVLRAAARLMRERVEGLIMPEPWRVAPAPSVWEGGVTEIHGRNVRSGHMTIYVPGSKSEGVVQARAEHIASWHPAMALAVADWLDAVATSAEKVDSDADDMFWGTEALAVARTYLGERA